MITVYRTSKYSTKIEAVEVARMTDKCVVKIIRNWKGKDEDRREAKVSQYHRYFDTEAEALDYLIERARKNLERYKCLTHEANTELGQLESQKRNLPARSAPNPSAGEGSPEVPPTQDPQS